MQGCESVTQISHQAGESRDHTLDQFVEVRGARVRFAVSGAGVRDLVLLHGHHANHSWWHRVAPLLEPCWRITRLDFSGHGDSDHRDGYDGSLWAEEVRAVAEAAGVERPVLVGHSMGGRIALAAAAERPAGISGVITLDTALRPPGAAFRFGWHPERVPRVRATKAEALGQFRLAPDQPEPAEEILAAVAEASVRQVDGGWTWKYDQRGLPGMRREYVEERLAALPVPVRFIYAERSAIVGADTIAYLQSIPIAGGVEIVEMPGLHHHLILEDPVRCAELIDEHATRLLG
ncbi:alpha/beta fold hydrolase [Aeromicrobium sp. S22]|nr:alpha/beta fold hydrolase [Aeromicrobium sp. S22]